jgi:nucleotide-binding universal stress UspA family protein
MGTVLRTEIRQQRRGIVAYATVMVHVDVDGSSDARIRLATTLADRFMATLIGISSCILPPYPTEGAYFVTRELVEEERRDMAVSLKRAEEAFRRQVGQGRAGIEWRSAIEVPDDYIAANARSGDLLVIARDQGSGGVCRTIDPGTTVLATGRPVFLVPPGVDGLKAEHVVVGWKESREARRALSDSLPFLHQAKAVSIIEVCEAGMEAAGQQHVDDVAHYLVRHRITVGSAIAVHAAGGVATELIRRASAENADLIVTGAYGHTRLGEWIFGGVTRSLLVASPVCCLMTH